MFVSVYIHTYSIHSEMNYKKKEMNCSIMWFCNLLLFYINLSDLFLHGLCWASEIVKSYFPSLSVTELWKYIHESLKQRLRTAFIY